MIITDPAFDADLPEPIVALGAVPGPDPRVLEAARVTLAERIAATPGRQRGGVGDWWGAGDVDHQKRRRVAIVATAAFATAAAVSAPAVLSGLGHQRSLTPAAVVITSTPSVTSAEGPADGQHAAWWYSKSVYRANSRVPYTLRQIWQSPTKTGRLIDGGVDSNPMALTNDDATGPNPDRSVFGTIGKDQELVYWPTLWQLPTDPAKLATLLREGSAGAGNGPDAELFVVVGDMLRESPAPLALRKALCQVALADPGAKNVGLVHDSQGRAGVAVERDTGGETQRYVFDPNDFRLLEETEGSYSMTYLVAGPVASDHDVLGS